MNVAAGEPGPGHVFTVLDATQSPDKIVEVGDRQTWMPDASGLAGTLLSTRDPAFWSTKKFKKIGLDYVAEYVDGKDTYTITLAFRIGTHMTAHKDVWMIYGARNCAGNCEGFDGPPTWGGQNER